jgi:filamentous hemagglutinin family protein
VNTNPVPPRSSRFVFTSLSIAIAHGFVSSGSCGSIHFDGSLGSAGALNGPNFFIPADRGKQVGGNLFHSFGDFNLIKNDVASFQGPSNVQNILARVTGGGASSIDGTLRSEISGANLYFINPAGVMFGANAKLEISGSFAVTTADYLKLADGGKFNARLGGDDLLTAAPVSAFGFLSPTPSPVSFSGSQLAVPAGQDFMVVAGDLTLDGAVVAAPSGRLGLVSGGAAGEVPSSPDALAGSGAAVLPAMGSIELKNGAFANIDGNGGGRVVIRGGRLQVVGGSLVSSENRGGAAGGRVDVRVTDSLILREGRIAANAIGAGRGGDVAVEAPALSIGGTAFVSGIFASSGSASGARGGDVDVRTNDLALTAGGTISTTTFGIGDCGDIHIAADRLSIDREGTSIPTGLFAAVALRAIGRGGNIFVESANASILGGGVISGDTLGQGNGGNVSVTAAHLRIDPTSSGFFTGISSTVNEGAIGDGGDVIVRSDELSLVSGASISANTFGQGNGGTAQVVATKLTLANGGIVARVGASAVGRGGDIIVQCDDLALTAGGTISASTFRPGRRRQRRHHRPQAPHRSEGISSFHGHFWKRGTRRKREWWRHHRPQRRHRDHRWWSDFREHLRPRRRWQH